jgi:hypothetical protein
MNRPMPIHRLVAAALLAAGTAAFASEPTIHVSVGGQVSPGVYGRVDFGNAPPPPVVYPQPVVIVHPAQPVAMAPVYLHVPPGHARHWAKHCQRYDACGRPVYFVKSAEYEPHDRKGHGKHGHDD